MRRFRTRPANPPQGGPAPAASRLPVELQHAIMDIVDQPTVLALAGVSHEWRTAATSHKNYYLFIRLFGSSNGSDSPPVGSHAAQKALAHAVRNGTRIVLVANYEPSPDSQRMHWWDNWKDRRELKAVIRFMQAAMPAVISLYISIPIRPMVYALLDALNDPAPRLQNLVLAYPIERHWLTSSVSELMAVPVSLFGGHAPSLQTVFLHCAMLPDKPIPAFSAATHVDLMDTYYHDLELSVQFPSATSVSVE